MDLKRRRFIQLTSLATASIPFLNFTKAIRKRAPLFSGIAEDDMLPGLFASPQNIHRPFVRWWWNGDRVTKTEVLRELDIMKEAGIGGVEINPIKWPENGDAIGIKELSWGSEEWLDVVDAAVKGAKEKGMVCDMIVGSGWPYGGEFVPREEQSQIIILGTKNIDGGMTHSFTQKELLDSVTPPSNYKNKMSELFMLRLAPAAMDIFTEGKRLDNQLKNETISITVPTGPHVLYYLVKITGFQAVIQGALGANGPVINHYEKAAVENYLNRFSEKLIGRIGPLNQYFRAFFTDSIELEGANWCSDMFAQFKQRRGYDVEPYFPYILFKVGEMGNAVNETYGAVFSPDVKANLNRIHYDFEQTRIALFHERFIKTFTSWCTKHGVKSRMQAYGMDCHPLEASMMIDIPECETWIWVPEIEEFGEHAAGRNYTMINKFVSSAAHLVGKQLISCEEMTNTNQIFSNTLERIKVTGDQSNLSGVTHSVLHGFNYSPLEVPFPGWIRYGCFFNERNTWWPYFRLWSDYKARMSCLFQHSVMQADIAILHPLADLASKYGFQRDPFPRVAYPAYVHQVWEAVHQHGNGCDYVSEHIIQQSDMKGGKLAYHERAYKAIFLIEVETLMPETAKALQRFANAGGKIIFVGKSPHMSSGLTGYRKKSEAISSMSADILSRHPKTTGVVASPGDDLLSWYHGIQKQFSLIPYIQISDPTYHVNQLHYKSRDRDIFFFSNYSGLKEHAFSFVFNTKKHAWIWDAETGKRYPYPSSAESTWQVSLGPCASKLVIFENAEPANAKPYTPFNRTAFLEQQVAGPWQLQLDHVNGVSKKITLDTPTDLKKRDDCKDFSGTITYRVVVPVTNLVSKTFLDIGHIHDVSEVEVNGMPMGSQWYGNHLYDVSEATRKGDNYVSIKVITTLGAYAKSLTQNKAAQEWSEGDLYGPTGLDAPVKILMSNE